ncbi:MAG: ankyrin repeat domain-containing protein [Cyanobacteria bacterium P01_D01_bin.73]
MSDLWSAIEAGDVERVRESLTADAGNINARDEGGRSPLMAACGYAQADCVEFLLTQGADISAQTDDGETALMGAAAAGNLAIVQRLIAAEADPTTTDKSGTTAMEYAAIKGHAEVVKYFRDTQPMDAEALRRSKFVAEVFEHPEVVKILTA